MRPVKIPSRRVLKRQSLASPPISCLGPCSACGTPRLPGSSPRRFARLPASMNSRCSKRAWNWPRSDCSRKRLALSVPLLWTESTKKQRSPLPLYYLAYYQSKQKEDKIFRRAAPSGRRHATRFRLSVPTRGGRDTAIRPQRESGRCECPSAPGQSVGQPRTHR